MAKLNEDYRRAIIVLVLGIFVALFIMFNAGAFITASVLYTIMGVLSILGYLIWDKF